MKRYRLPRPLWVAVGVVAFGMGGALADDGGGKYAGKEVCSECHEDAAAGLANTPHGRSGFAKLSDHGCETCHGPALAHTEDPDNDDVRKMMSPKRLSPKEVAERCQQCHDGAKQFFWPGSKHDSRGVSCIDCHSVHAFKSDMAQLKEKSVMETCFQCHKTIRAETWKVSHHPIREGRISCGDCHNPHGGPAENMLNASSVNEQCYSCHTEKRGPFLWEHAPVRESCMNCHTPHGSNHLKLQRTSVPYLCQQCHSNTRHPGTLYDATSLADAESPRNRIFNRGCPNCHPAVHGSNHPSAPYLGR